MMNNLIYFKRKMVDTFKHDINTLLPVFVSDSPISELEKRYKTRLVFNTNVTCPDCILLDDEGNCISELDAVKTIYGNLRGLAPNLASEECMWSAMCLSDKFWPYVRKRWKINKIPESIEERTKLCGQILVRIFFGKEPYTRNTLARLWWLGKLTYKEDAEDPYDVATFICSIPDGTDIIFERTQGANRTLVRRVCLRLMTLQKQGIKIDRPFMRALFKYLNAYGGFVLIDSLVDNIEGIMDYFLNLYEQKII